MLYTTTLYKRLTAVCRILIVRKTNGRCRLRALGVTILPFDRLSCCSRWFGVGSSRDSWDSLDRRQQIMSLEPIDAENALELYQSDKKNELSEASLKSHKYRLGHFVRVVG